MNLPTYRIDISRYSQDLSTIKPYEFPEKERPDWDLKRDCDDETYGNVTWTYNLYCRLQDNKPAPPNQWHVSYPNCAGAYQSPINIQVFDDEMDICDEETPVYEFYMYHAGNCTYNDMDYINNVEGWGADFKCNDPPIFMINEEEYLVDKLIFHLGSEHLFDGAETDGEMQLYLYDKFDHENLVNVAVLIEVELELNFTDIYNIWGRIVDIVYEGELDSESFAFFHGYEMKEPTEKFDIFNIMPDFLGYYTYFGSETVPPCNENIRWVVFAEKLTVGFIEFQELKREIIVQNDTLINHLGLSSRPVQPLHYRFVEYCVL
eukprot:CAMPEP_0171456424 /NCGR_PEP_ID=MMETSP0945-20130129/2913_1 /TAXON_ID=109269 /ORGANISM="Vaucheria litorea, Strain CCMP2940" /LENGTH=318 /DNA_ID=CAMNT_0011981839 /DNA_START=325 /DNA_END=1281 /DNA_ORIENTATION=+